MNKNVITIRAITKDRQTSGKAYVDKGILRMPYPMDTAGKRLYAYNKYYRWFWNSVNLSCSKVTTELNNLKELALSNGQLVLVSDYTKFKSHVDIIMEYMAFELHNTKSENGSNFEVELIRKEPLF